MKEQSPDVLCVKGSRGLARLTGFSSKQTHAEWRAAGLKYYVTAGGVFFYFVSDVEAFLRTWGQPQEIKEEFK